MWKLVIEDDEGKRTVVPLTRDDYTIGRKEGNTIRLTERNVSRAHAKIRKLVNGGGQKLHYILEDLTSYNGVYVNGVRVAQTQDIAHGDLVQIGDYRIVLQDDAAVDAQPPSPPTAGGQTPSTLDPKVTIPQGQRASLLMERPNRLVMLAGPTPGQEFPLDDERLTIGRAEDASISVNHNSVSRLHCEVHALGDGRFEIVDKGSSNGVRVNTAELRRGIIEPGDVIELGDVKFKFVGAGQIFLPGVNDSQQLAAISDRDATSISRRRSGGLVPYVLLGAVVAAVAVGAWMLTRPKPEPVPISPITTATVSSDPAQQALDEAKKLCDTGDCDTAHEKINSEIPPQSPLRDSQDFRNIEYRWADALLSRADSETDLGKKHALYDMVARAPAVDAVRRKRAADALQALDEASMTPQQLPIANGAKDAGAPSKPDAGTWHRTSNPEGNTPIVSTSPPSPPTPRPSAVSISIASAR